MGEMSGEAIEEYRQRIRMGGDHSYRVLLKTNKLINQSYLDLNPRKTFAIKELLHPPSIMEELLHLSKITTNK